MTNIYIERLINFIDKKGASLGLTSANICNFKEIVRSFSRKSTDNFCNKNEKA